MLTLQGIGDRTLPIGLAWGYVALRIAHSLVQATFSHVPTRFAVFVVSTGTLIALTVQAALALR